MLGTHLKVDKGPWRLTVMLLALVLLNPKCNGSDLSAKQLANTVLKSTALITTKDKCGTLNSIGSGFVVKSGIIATNMHVIDGADFATINIIGNDLEFKTSTVVAYDRENDIALLRFDDVNAKFLNLDKNRPEIGEHIYVSGSPKGMEGTFSDGIVSAHRFFKSKQLIQITAPISPGSSGGPVVNTSGNVIGMAIGAIEGGQNLNFAIPAEKIIELINRPFRFVEFSDLIQKKIQIKPEKRINTIGVEVGHLKWVKKTDGSGWRIYFLIQNLTNTTVKDIEVIVKLIDKSGKPVATHNGTYYGQPYYIQHFPNNGSRMVRNTGLGPLSAEESSFDISNYQKSLVHHGKALVIRYTN